MLALATALLATAAAATPQSQQEVSQAADAAPPAEQATDPRTRRAERRAARRRLTQAAEPASSRSEGSVVVESGEVVVTGIRESVKNAIDTKRKARQIVDVVNAEDAGKLPDNNVIEALARVPGINITRSRGQGDGLTIRGLSGVQTTINGSEVTGAAGRAIDLSTIPADLIKSVEVYKNRTADQVEGGIGGTVNVELRRPLDLHKGLTVAGSVRESYNSQGSNWSPNASLLIADRFDTGIGQIGFLVNVGYQNVKYNEPYTYNESVNYFYNRSNPRDTFRSNLYNSLPASLKATAAAPFRIAYGVDDGNRVQPSLNGVLQWAPSDKLNFILEGSYFGSKENNRYNSLYVNTREDYYSILNPRVGASGALLGYDIVNTFVDAQGNRVNSGDVRAGIAAGQARTKVDNYHGNFETHWADAGVRIDATAQYDRNTNNVYSNGYEGWFNNLPQVRVDFDRNPVPGGGPTFDFYNVDVTSPTDQRVRSLSDNLGSYRTTQYAGQIDLSVDVSPTALIRRMKLGSRFRRSINEYGSSYRYAGWADPSTRPTLGSVPGASVITITPTVKGGDRISWAQLDARGLFNNWDDVRAFIIANNPSDLDGPGRDDGVASLFAAPRPSSEDVVYAGSTTENVFSAYGMIDYAFKAGFPIDGNVGLRFNNTFGNFTGRNLQLGRVITDRTGTPVRDDNGNLQFLPDVIQPDGARANYLDLLPSAFMTVHFTPKLQLRGSYSHNVERPDIQSLRAYRNVYFADLLTNPNATIYAGNPDLKPTTTDDFNAALEWYFGQGGIVSLTGFYKKQKGFIYDTRILQPVAELDGRTAFVQQPRNAGPGKTAGLEFEATSFFTFLPGVLRHLGASANGTWIPTADLSLPVETDPKNAPGVYALVQQRAPYTSRFSYNLIGYYESSKLSMRVAYNWRSKFFTNVDAINPTYVATSAPVSRLDAAINFTPVKYLTLSLEGNNLTNRVDYTYWTVFPDLPNGFRQMGRTIQASARFRF
jgi:TonB-dependent receptor